MVISYLISGNEGSIVRTASWDRKDGNVYAWIAEDDNRSGGSGLIEGLEAEAEGELQGCEIPLPVFPLHRRRQIFHGPSPPLSSQSSTAFPVRFQPIGLYHSFSTSTPASP